MWGVIAQCPKHNTHFTNAQQDILVCNHHNYRIKCKYQNIQNYLNARKRFRKSNMKIYV